MDSEHSEYSELYERCSESRIKSEDIYGQESNNTEEKKSHSPNSELDNPNLNIEVQQNIIQITMETVKLLIIIVHYIQIIIIPNL